MNTCVCQYSCEDKQVPCAHVPARAGWVGLIYTPYWLFLLAVQSCSLREIVLSAQEYRDDS